MNFSKWGHASRGEVQEIFIEIAVESTNWFATAEYTSYVSGRRCTTLGDPFS